MAGWEKFFLYMPTNNNITIMLFDFTKFKKKRKKISWGRLERGSACLSFATHYWPQFVYKDFYFILFFGQSASFVQSGKDSSH